MKIQQLIALIAGGAVLLGLATLIDRALPARARAIWRWIAAGAASIGLFVAIDRFIDARDRAADWVKLLVALAAAFAVFYEAHRVGMRKPIAERWKKFIGVTLAAAAVACYFSGFRFGYPNYFHRHDQFHYYMGAKYFPEMGYDGLYKCVAIAEDEIGEATYTNDDTGRSFKIDLRKEVRHPDAKVRNLGADNLLIPAIDVVEHPEICKPRFSPQRWEQFKRDVIFFRGSSDKGYWEGMQKDHGYNPPPVWTVAGYFFANLHDASTRYCQFLASFDLVYLFGVFAALWWAFGWRVSCAAAIFWGTQASAPFLWTGGAFLRQDWLFWLVFGVCLLRKRWFKWAGAALVYSALLRVFPGLVIVGIATVAATALVRKRTMPKDHRNVLLGAVLAAAVLVPVSLKVAGTDSYKQFYKHTIQVHDQTPLTNHMGLRVLISDNVGTGPASGRMKYTQDNKLLDPFEVWKRMRNERYAKYRWIGYLVIAASLAAFVYVVRKMKSLWVATCLAQIFIILLSQLTCYYYSFMVLSAPLCRIKRQIEPFLFGLAALTQVIAMFFVFNDDKYTALTAVSLAFCYGLVCAFSTRGAWKLGDEAEPASAQT